MQAPKETIAFNKAATVMVDAAMPERPEEERSKIVEGILKYTDLLVLGTASMLQERVSRLVAGFDNESCPHDDGMYVICCHDCAADRILRFLGAPGT